MYSNVSEVTCECNPYIQTQQTSSATPCNSALYIQEIENKDSIILIIIIVEMN